MNSLFDKLWARGYAETNRSNILSLLHPQHKPCRFIDLGCDEGSLTTEVAQKINATSIYSLEKNYTQCANCVKKGISVVCGDLDEGVPFKDESFDVVLSNQVIEHVCNTDFFLKEIHRILTPQGYAIISTNNISSWTNIVALLFGKQPFPSHVSDEILTGRFFSRDEPLPAATSAHRRVFSFPALAGLLRHHRFEIIEIKGSCFYPLRGFVERFFERLLPLYSAYIIMKVRKV
jgi:methionine biosynthesis protein MetW